MEMFKNLSKRHSCKKFNQNKKHFIYLVNSTEISGEEIVYWNSFAEDLKAEFETKKVDSVEIALEKISSDSVIIVISSS